MCRCADTPRQLDTEAVSVVVSDDRVVDTFGRVDTPGGSAKFQQISLVFGCIGTDLCKYVRVL